MPSHGNGGVIWLDSPFTNGGGSSTLAVGGTLTVSSTNSNALYIGNTFIGAGDTLTAAALVNTGTSRSQGTAPSNRCWTSPPARPASVQWEQRPGQLPSPTPLLEFASGQIGTIDGGLGLNGANALIADAGTLTTNSALTGLNTVSGDFRSGCRSVGHHDRRTEHHRQWRHGGIVRLDSPFNNGGGGSSLNVGGTLTNSSTNSNALYIGNTIIGAGDTVTAKALVNTGIIQIAGNGAIQSTLDITTGAAGFGTVGVETGSVSLHNMRCWSSPAARSARSMACVGLNGVNARIADASNLTTNSALTGLNTVSGRFPSVSRSVGHHHRRTGHHGGTMAATVASFGSTPRSITAAAAAA